MPQATAQRQTDVNQPYLIFRNEDKDGHNGEAVVTHCAKHGCHSHSLSAADRITTPIDAEQAMAVMDAVQGREDMDTYGLPRHIRFAAGMPVEVTTDDERSDGLSNSLSINSHGAGGWWHFNIPAPLLWSTTTTTKQAWRFWIWTYN